MENRPEIPEVLPTLPELLKGVIDEEYSAFFVCIDEYTAGVVEQAASESEIGRATLLDSVAREATEQYEGQNVRPFLEGELVFLKDPWSEFTDVTTYSRKPNEIYWYISLSRQDIVYWYTQDSENCLEQTFPFSLRKSLRNI